MNPIWLISIVESLLVLTLVASLLFVRWRNKRRHHSDFELLLDDIKDRQGARGNKLSRRFVDKFHFDPPAAQGLSEQLITAEKLFLQQFIEQQMQQKSVAGFYENLCELLDSYLTTLSLKDSTTPHLLGEADEIPEPTTKGNTIVDDNIIVDGPTVKAGNGTDDENTPPPPDWGDVFD